MRGREDRAKFSVLMFWLADRMLSPGGQPKDVGLVLEDYYSALLDLPIQRLEWGARHLFKSSKWFPMPVEFREAAMLAPSSVMPALPCNQPVLCEFTEAEVIAAKEKFEAFITEEVPLMPAVYVAGCARPVYGL